ncbi:hypothetical protein GCM10027034_12810 [Ramlibacter solisilvae]|nr:hypothetical protein [Ramlibacter tataouinensis]
MTTKPEKSRLKDHDQAIEYALVKLVVVALVLVFTPMLTSSRFTRSFFSQLSDLLAGKLFF